MELTYEKLMIWAEVLMDDASWINDTTLARIIGMAQMASQASGDDTISVFAELDQDDAETRSQEVNETMGHVVQTNDGDLVFEFEH
jgi:hypothetical protein